jgi:ribosome-associated protein
MIDIRTFQLRSCQWYADKRMLSIPNTEIEIETSRSGGPGGQHVNKTSSKVTLRWNLSKSSALSDEQKQICLLRLKTRINTAGELVLHVEAFRSQVMNRQRAYERLHELVNDALTPRKKRIKTHVSEGAKARRVEAKKRRGQLKKLRQISE